MNQLDQVRLEKHKEYRRQTWLPQFFEKYGKYFDPKTKAMKVISKFVSKHALPPVINSEHLEYIPGFYRVRLRLTDENLYPPVIQKQENNKDSNTKDNKKRKENNDSSDDEPSYSTAPHMHDEVFFEDNPIEADMNQVMKESLKEYNTATLDQVMTESIKDNHEVDYDEYILNQAILESLNNGDLTPNNNLSNNHVSNENAFSNNTNQSFYYVVDIRGYIGDLTQPIIVYGDTYYLSNKQIDYMQKLWQKLNPETPAGLKFQQDFDFYKGLAKDLAKDSTKNM